MTRKALIMKRKIQLKNSQVSSYFRTDDALKAFNDAVDNGQTRLALQVLTEILDDLTNVPDEEKSKDNNDSKVQQETKQKAEVKKENSVKEKQEEKLQPEV